VYNIEVAAEKFVGTVIPPGGVFSFNSTVEAVSGANGFEDSAIIWGDRTAVGVGGGVCQVSTTVIRAALEAGFPLLERHNHGYVVSWYGQPGKDATIFSPYVDFRFRNDTSAWLLIQPSLDLVQGTLTFDIFGTAFDRVVTVSEPVISDVIEPEEPLYLEDAALAPGEQRLVETEKLGMTVTVDRTIVQHGRSRTERFRSVYQPWRAVYLVGYDPEAGADGADPVDQALSAAGASA
jgi:vancomycin resistance protein YoaR